MRLFAPLLALALVCATHRMAIAHFDFHARALLPASRLAIQLSGIGTPQNVALVGQGRIEGGFYLIPPSAQPGLATLVAAGSGALAVRTIRIASPPRAPLIAVAAYDDGLVFHDPRTFAERGTLATGGPPSDVAALGDALVTTDTDGNALTRVDIAPWNAARIPGIDLGDEIISDPPLDAIFATERGGETPGGLARVEAGKVTHVATGTAEGVTLDARRQRVYVADVDRADVAVVDAHTMHVVERIRGIPRAFSLALSPDGARLYVVSNQGRHTILGAPGLVTELMLYPHPRVVARSLELRFPVGIALDARGRRVFVTDEQADLVYVLDARTLRAIRPPLRTCSIPWKPLLVAPEDRLFVPCAGSDEIDVFDARTLSRVHGAPFHTGGYPLAVAVVQ
jgi:sugar lactone lactonase YvrE